MYNDLVTVCIAAFAERGKKLVLTADQMVSLAFPLAYQYETEDVAKIFDLTDNVVVLSAGIAVFAQEIVDNAKKQISNSNISSVADIAETVRREYSKLRTRLITQQFLEPRGFTLDTYYEKQNKLHPAVIQDIESKISGENIQVELIVAGHDGEECQIFSIHNPGTLVSHAAVGYSAVGIGAPHAIYSLIDDDYKRTLDEDEVKEMVVKAKKRSEKAPGVGQRTTTLVLPKTGGRIPNANQQPTESR